MYAGFVMPVHLLFPEAFQELDDEFGMLDDLDEFGNLEEESEESPPSLAEESEEYPPSLAVPCCFRGLFFGRSLSETFA